MLIRQLSVNSGMVWDKYENALQRGKFHIGSLDKLHLYLLLPHTKQKSPCAVRAVHSSRVMELGLSLPCCVLFWQLFHCLSGQRERQRRWSSATPLAWGRIKDMYVWNGFSMHKWTFRSSPADSCEIATALSRWANYMLSCAYLMRIWPNSFYLKAIRLFRVCPHKINWFMYSLMVYFCCQHYPLSQLWFQSRSDFTYRLLWQFSLLV